MCFVVITKTYFNAANKPAVLNLSKNVQPIFKNQPGLISIRMHLSSDDTHTMTYLKWKSKKDHEACMASPDFNDWNKEWEKLLSDKKVTWELNTYEIL